MVWYNQRGDAAMGVTAAVFATLLKPLTTKGITALCDGLKQSKVSSLRCVGPICEHV